MESKVVAGIITYNPDISRLRENVEAIHSQVDSLVIVDNGSSNCEDIINLLESKPGVCYVFNSDNVGVAKALNMMAAKAHEMGAEWLLTLDQDSVVAENMMAEYAQYTSDSTIGIITCRYVDRNTESISHFTPQENSFISRCITSGTYMNLNVWEQVGGFYEPLFIDQVDFDYCYTVREKGYKILQIGSTYLLHEIGKSKGVYLFGNYHIAFNHSPLRYYYMIRNMIVVAKRHGMWRHYLHVIVRRIVIVNKFENNRWKKNLMMLRGIWHSIIGRLGKYS